MSSQDIAVQSANWSSNSVLKEKRENPGQQNYMPFLFRSKRDFPYNGKEQSPAVGAYSISGNLAPKQVSPSLAQIDGRFTKQYENVAFKSHQARFNDHKNSNPGPTSYDHPNSKKVAQNSPQKEYLDRARDKHKQIFEFTHQKSHCPAIPDTQVKYGYVRDKEGKYQVIQKSDDQIEKERIRLKKYFDTLKGQKNYPDKNAASGLFVSHENQERRLVSQASKVLKKPNTGDQYLKSVEKTVKVTKPKIKLSHQVIPQRQNLQNLGPGCYETKLNTINSGKKNEKFQFFGSSQKRFESNLKQSNEKQSYEQILIEKRNSFPSQPKNTKNSGMIYKKSFVNVFDPSSLEKEELPGPCSYEPIYESCKKSYGVAKFGCQSRFKDREVRPAQENFQGHFTNHIRPENQEAQASQKVQWGLLRKEKVSSPQKVYQPVNQNEIFGIMNEQPSDKEQIAIKQKVHHKKQCQNKNQGSAVFRNGTDRFGAVENKRKLSTDQKPNINEVSESKTKKVPQRPTKLTGSYISKLAKGDFHVPQEQTPGPGAYEEKMSTKKSFNIKK